MKTKQNLKLILENLKNITATDSSLKIYYWLIGYVESLIDNLED